MRHSGGFLCGCPDITQMMSFTLEIYYAEQIRFQEEHLECHPNSVCDRRRKTVFVFKAQNFVGTYALIEFSCGFYLSRLSLNDDLSWWCTRTQQRTELKREPEKTLLELATSALPVTRRPSRFISYFLSLCPEVLPIPPALLLAVQLFIKPTTTIYPHTVCKYSGKSENPGRKIHGMPRETKNGVSDLLGLELQEVMPYWTIITYLEAYKMTHQVLTDLLAISHSKK
ncbi:hypothetical protein STEG23_031844 [Scotinomys teguina]